MGFLDPIRAFAKHIDDSRKINLWDSTGATVLITKCYADRIECWSSGDSQFMIFKDGELTYISKQHNPANPEERQRVIDKGLSFIPSSSIKLISEISLESAASEYMVFPSDMRKLACTQALGHNSRTGYSPEKHVIHLVTSSSYRVVMGSDGLFDMTMLGNSDDIQYLRTQTSDEICNKTVKRWLQEWEGHMSDGSVHKFNWQSQHCDDVSVIVIDVIPK
jgi:serine/threonine protein phosphatase PrpC